jgi:hypothetical protein
MGYHLKPIPKGKFGEVSKIEEELAEIKDAEEQGNRLMVLVELSDLIGAVQGYLNKHYVDFELSDLIKMSEATSRAFLDGTRK